MPNTIQTDQADPHLAHAMEAASAPGLTLTKRCEKLLETIDVPDLFKYENPANRGQNESSRKILTMASFQQSAEYEQFKSILSDTFHALDTIASETALFPSAPQPFQTLGSRLWQPADVRHPSHYGVFQADLIQQACPNARRLLRLHEFAKQHPDLVATNSQLSVVAGIKGLAGSVDVCGPGVVQNFEEAVGSARQTVFTPSLKERFEALRLELIRNTIADDMRRYSLDQYNLPNFEIHLVAAWQNYFSKELNLPVIDDVYASPQYTLNQHEQHRLNQKLHAVHTRPAVAKVLAAEILQDANALWHSAQAKGATDFGQHCMALLNTLQSTHGELSAHALIRMDENSEPVAFHNNPTLLALHIVEQLASQPSASSLEPGVNHLWSFSDSVQERSLTIKQCGPLVWMEISDTPGSDGSHEKYLLSAQQLKPIEFESFMSTIGTNSWGAELRKSALLEMLITDWGHAQPQLQAYAFDRENPNELFVHFAMGLAQGRKFGPAEMKDELFQRAARGFVKSFEHSRVHELYTAADFLQLLEYTRAWNAQALPLGPIDVSPFLLNIGQLRNSGTAVNAFQAVIQFQSKYHWQNFVNSNYRVCQALLHRDERFGFAFLEVIKAKDPQALSLLLYRNISRMRSPDLILAFVDAGADPNADLHNGHTVLHRLLAHTRDEFIAKTLTQLEQREVPLNRICSQKYVNELIQQRKPVSASILSSLIEAQ